MARSIDRALAEIARNPLSQLVLLGMITLIAFALRFYKLGEWSFWGDEYITVQRALAVSQSNFHLQPLSTLGISAALSIFGVSEWSARLLAAVVGGFSVPVLFFLVRQVFDSMAALLASFLLAVSPWHIYWSQNARFYTVLLLLYTVALFLFYVGIEKDRPWYLVVALVFLGLAMRERLFAGFLVPIAIGYLAFLKVLPFEKPAGLRLRNLAVLAGPGIVAGAVLVLFGPGVPPLESWQRGFSFVNNNPLWIAGGVFFYVGITLLCVCFAGAVYLLLQRSRAGLLLGLAAVFPLSAIMLLSMFVYTANRYVFVSLTSMVVLAGLAANELVRQGSREGKLLGLGVILALFLSAMGDNALYYQYQNGNRDNWKSALALIADSKEDGDLVVTTHRELADFYLGENTLGMQRIEIDDLVTRKTRSWFVVDLTAPDKAPEVHRWILENTLQLADMDVTVNARTFPMRIHLYDPELIPIRVGLPTTTSSR
jgi:mannosyltransferase